MPGYKVYLQDGGEIREGLTCWYCRLLLKDPVQTSESGLRLCKECYEKASKDPSQTELDPNDEIWPDSAVKREIANLKVKCENYMVGCDWEGLFKQLMQHSQQCQYVTVECRNPGCGQRVLLTKIEIHLKEECPRRRVKCKNCDESMIYSELQDHNKVCPNAVRQCRNCSKEMLACKISDHMIHECNYVRCVCKENNDAYEAGSTQFYSHLQDVSKLADHLGPMICEFTKMSEAFKEMSIAYQQATKRIDTLEKGRQEDVERIKMLEKNCHEYAQKVETLEKGHEEYVQRINKQYVLRLETLEKGRQEDAQRIVMLEGKNSKLEEGAKQADSKMEIFEQRLTTVREEAITLSNRHNSQLMVEVESVKQQYSIAMRTSKGYNSEVVPYEKSSDLVKQVEEKVLEVERTLNVLSVHHSELELQLQASLASTHNGAFLWRIPEVQRRIRDAKMGRITSIYSPPFYTGRNGYKMCIRAYLNGDGAGEGTHLSIFFVLMRGEYDPLLQWPFEPKVSLILVDQDHKKHIVQTFKPNAQSSSFQRPKTDMNVASGCPEFADLLVLHNTGFVKDDVMYIKAIVDTSKIFHP